MKINVNHGRELIMTLLRESCKKLVVALLKESLRIFAESSSSAKGVMHRGGCSFV